MYVEDIRYKIPILSFEASIEYVAYFFRGMCVHSSSIAGCYENEHKTNGNHQEYGKQFFGARCQHPHLFCFCEPLITYEHGTCYQKHRSDEIERA